MKFDTLRAISTCYSQFHREKSSFLERSHSPLSNNVSNFLFHLGANLKIIQKAAFAMANAPCSFILKDRDIVALNQSKRLIFTSTTILQGNIRDGVQNDPKGLI
jgi:hypothetical protein